MMLPGLLFCMPIGSSDTSRLWKIGSVVAVGACGRNGDKRRLMPLTIVVMADAGHESSKLARHLLRHESWELVITRRGQRAFKIKGLTWIVERSFAWLGRNRRFSKDYEFRVQTSETMIDVAAIRLMLNRIAPE